MGRRYNDFKTHLFGGFLLFFCVFFARLFDTHFCKLCFFSCISCVCSVFYCNYLLTLFVGIYGKMTENPICLGGGGCFFLCVFLLVCWTYNFCKLCSFFRVFRVFVRCFIAIACLYYLLSTSSFNFCTLLFVTRR